MDIKELLFGSEDFRFIPEVLLRTAIMYIVILTGLHVLGKRGVRQLSVFELVVIIGLGSAAGDPMFYKDVGIVTGMAVFLVIILAYKSTTFLVGKSRRFEALLEGKPVYLIREGVFAVKNFDKEALAKDEFFTELRVKGVSHLGQVSLAIIETNGSLSVFFEEDESVRFGLPIIPDLFEKKTENPVGPDYYSCSHCGYTEVLEGPKGCPDCGRRKWVRSVNGKRVK